MWLDPLWYNTQSVWKYPNNYSYFLNFRSFTTSWIVISFLNWFKVVSSLHSLLLIMSSWHHFGNIIFSCFTLKELDISELGKPWCYLWLMYALILFRRSYTFSVTLKIQEYIFSVYDVPHDSMETEFGRRLSILQYEHRCAFGSYRA